LSVDESPKHNVIAEPAWQDYRAAVTKNIPTQWRQWLFDRGSLTQRLKVASNGAFRVHICQQRVQRPQLSEQRLLNMPNRHLAMIREVLLYGNDQPWVYARSVLPLSSLTGSQRHLRKLDNRPLGALLFANPGMRRGAIQIGHINPRNLALPDTLGAVDTSLWGRRSLFYIDAKPLLVSEIFLPAFCPYNKPLNSSPRRKR